ncbi:uncharacterized protein METZ01_LOCUS487938, partial [marine metagenome]
MIWTPSQPARFSLINQSTICSGVPTKWTFPPTAQCSFL